MKKKKKEKEIVFKNHFHAYYIWSISFPNTLIMRLIFDFCQFSQFSLNLIKCLISLKRQLKSQFEGLACTLIWLRASRFLDDVCPFSNQGRGSPLGRSEGTCNSFHIPGNEAPGSSYSFSLGDHSNVSPN